MGHMTYISPRLGMAACFVEFTVMESVPALSARALYFLTSFKILSMENS